MSEPEIPAGPPSGPITPAGPTGAAGPAMPAGPVWPATPAGSAATSSPGPARAPRRGSGRLVVVLAAACAVLLLATIALGVTALWQSRERAEAQAAARAAEQELADRAVGSVRQLDDRELVVVSDIAFDEFLLTAPDGNGFTALYAPVENTDAERAAEVFFDVTAYAADGAVIDRTPASLYLLPGQKSLFQGILAADLSRAESFKVEQTSLDLTEPIMSGGIVLDSLAGSDGGYVEGALTSTLSQAPEYPDLFFVGVLDGKIFAVCNDLPDIPANGGFTASCRLESVERPGEEIELPEDAVFDAYLALDIPF